MGLSPLPRKVRFGSHIGEIIDEVSCRRDFTRKDCLFLIQNVRWSDGSETVRFAYYTKPHGTSEGEWGYANRPPNMEPKVLRELIKKARAKPWFREAVE